VITVEKTREFHGQYHVLHGSLSPLQSIGPDQLKLKNLLERLRGGTVKELILATSPPWKVKPRPCIFPASSNPGVNSEPHCHGNSRGLGMEYADEVTMLKAMEGRARCNPLLLLSRQSTFRYPLPSAII